MSYTKTYVCDFRQGVPRCRMLADGACALCGKHGCFSHLPNAARVVFELGDGVLPLPDLPLANTDPVDDTLPLISTFGDWNKFTEETRRKAYLSAEAREYVERRICAECFKELHGSYYRTAGGTEVIQNAMIAFLQALRAGMAAHAVRGDQAEGAYELNEEGTS